MSLCFAACQLFSGHPTIPGPGKGQPCALTLQRTRLRPSSIALGQDFLREEAQGSFPGFQAHKRSGLLAHRPRYREGSGAQGLMGLSPQTQQDSNSADG